MTTSTLRFAAATATAGLALLVGVAPAGASTSAPAATFTKAKCNQAINERVWILDVSEQRIGQVKRLTAEQKAAQIAGIDAVEANLVNVNRPAVAAARTRAQITSACQAIYRDNRVYAVVVPQLFASVRIDEFGNAFDKFDPMIAEKRAAGVDTSAVETLENSAKAHVDTAAALVSGITPDSFNADPAGTRATFDRVTAELNAAFGDILNAIVAYRNLPPAPPTA